MPIAPLSSSAAALAAVEAVAIADAAAAAAARVDQLQPVQHSSTAAHASVRAFRHHCGHWTDALQLPFMPEGAGTVGHHRETPPSSALADLNTVYALRTSLSPQQLLALPFIPESQH